MATLPPPKERRAASGQTLGRAGIASLIVRPMPKLLFAFLAVALRTSGPAEAQDLPMYVTGNTLLAGCRSENPTDVAMCKGYILGVADLLASFRPFHNLTIAKVCIPVTVFPDRVWDVVIDFLRKDAPGRDNPAAPKVYAALREAYPCHSPN